MSEGGTVSQVLLESFRMGEGCCATASQPGTRRRWRGLGAVLSLQTVKGGPEHCALSLWWKVGALLLLVMAELLCLLR